MKATCERISSILTLITMSAKLLHEWCSLLKPTGWPMRLWAVRGVCQGHVDGAGDDDGHDDDAEKRPHPRTS
jgi:hypothetical protein